LSLALIPPATFFTGWGNVKKHLAGPKASQEIRAVYLSYLIHLIGDMHQPLHCCSLVTEVYPSGDKGGNLYD